jgi:hypothetical protein
MFDQGFLVELASRLRSHAPGFPGGHQSTSVRPGSRGQRLLRLNRVSVLKRGGPVDATGSWMPTLVSRIQGRAVQEGWPCD